MVQSKCILQQNTDPIHTANVIKNYLQHKKRRTMSPGKWPPQSPNLNVSLSGIM